MDLAERKSRLKMFLEMELDKDMLSRLKVWYADVDNLFSETGDIGHEDSKRLLLKHFSYILSDQKRAYRLGHILAMVQTFEDVLVEIDGISIEETGKQTQEVFNNLAC